MLARKLPFYALTFVIAITIDFFIPRLMPGNALDAVLAKAGSQMGSPQALHALAKLYGIDNPAGLPTQYAQFWESLLHGNLGVSTSSYPTPVTSVIATALPWTVALVGAATVISFVLGTGIGILVAWRRGTSPTCSTTRRCPRSPSWSRPRPAGWSACGTRCSPRWMRTTC